ncbi:MAG: glutamine synthetase beta-grasp domain-containing protein, partial [Methanolobus sp.]|nr:glutamine synthetase beta-grasp domain-containing protein [Methanolobus sp.]
MQTKDEVLKAVEENDVKFIRLWFTNILGILKSFAITKEKLELAMDEGMGFDGSSIEGYRDIEESDMVAMPDPSTFQILPWRPQERSTARMFVDVLNPDGSNFEGDPRHVVLCPSLEAAEGADKLSRMLNIPLGDDGFIEEKHVKIDPVSSLNPSVFVAGCAVGPKDIHDSVTEGISAAHKVGQFLGKGQISISPEKPVISDACQQCGGCINECPYDALSGDGIPVLEALSCTDCGICAAVCPSGAIEIQNYRYDQLISQVEGILTAGPGVIVFIDRAAYAA